MTQSKENALRDEKRLAALKRIADIAHQPANGSLNQAGQSAPVGQNGIVEVYYEGGIYSRPAERKPTEDERCEYALHAAGRATQDYPTRAMFVLPGWTGIEAAGEVDTATWQVTFGHNPDEGGRQ